MNKKIKLLKTELVAKKFNKVLKALEFAEKKHKGQYRTDKKTEYIEHPINVCSYLLHHGTTNENILCVALLHDILEDTDTTYDELQKYFPDDEYDDLAEGVKVLTKKSNQSLDDYFDNIEKYDIYVYLKGVDRLMNLLDMDNGFTEKRRKRYIDETKTYILPMLEVRYFLGNDFVELTNLIQDVINNKKVNNKKYKEALDYSTTEYLSAEWIETSAKSHSGKKCSNCKGRISYNDYINGNHKYCHKCGAVMTNFMSYNPYYDIEKKTITNYKNIIKT